MSNVYGCDNCGNDTYGTGYETLIICNKCGGGSPRVDTYKFDKMVAMFRIKDFLTVNNIVVTDDIAYNAHNDMMNVTIDDCNDGGYGLPWDDGLGKVLPGVAISTNWDKTYKLINHHENDSHAFPEEICTDNYKIEIDYNDVSNQYDKLPF